MATIANRSRYLVSVRNSPVLTRDFSSKKRKSAQANLQQLCAQGYSSAGIDQGNDILLVRFRDQGYKAQTLTARCYEEAERLIAEGETERQRGAETDRAQAQRVTFAELVDRYIEERCRAHKGIKRKPGY